MDKGVEEETDQHHDPPVQLNLDTIPIEVLLQVFNFVDATDLLRNVSLVSRYFHAILCNEMNWKIKMEKRWGAIGDRKFPPIDLLPDAQETENTGEDEESQEHEDEPKFSGTTQDPETLDSKEKPKDPESTADALDSKPADSSYSKIFTTSRFPWSRACVKREEQIKVWTSSPERLSHATLRSHIGCIDSIHLFKEQDRMLLVSGSRDRTISLWSVEQALTNGAEDVSKIKSVNRAHDGWIWDFAVNSNNLFSCSWDTTAKIWDIETMSVFAEFKSKSALLSISTNGTTMAIGAYNREILLLDPRSPTKQTQVLTTHTGPVLSVGLDESYLISCGEDGVVARHDLRANKLQGSFKLPPSSQKRSYPTCLSFRKTLVNLPYFYVGDNSGNIHLIDLLNFRITQTCCLHAAPVRGVFNNLGSVVSCSRAGKLVVSSSCLGLTRLREVDVGDRIELPCVHSLDNVVACGGGDGVIRIWGCTSSL